MWKTIDTVPRDGMEVMIYLGTPYNQVRLAHWFEAWGNWQEGPDPDPAMDNYCGIGSGVPTHWMPLPSPPAS